VKKLSKKVFELNSASIILPANLTTMRILLFIFLMISFTRLFAQNDTAIVFYDRNGKVCEEENASKFALQTKEGNYYKQLMADMADNKVQSISYFSDSEYKNFNGPYRELYKNGKMRMLGYYSENKKINTWKTWSDDGILTDSLVYVDGFISGIGLTWDKEGNVTDSLIFEKNGNGVGHGYWSNGKPRENGTYKSGKKDGIWTYFYKTGTKCQEVSYVADSAVSYICFDENGTVQKGDCIYEKEASFPGGEKKWIEYLSKKLNAASYPNAYYNGKIYGKIWIQFIVDKDGYITDAKLLQSVDPRLDAIALNIIRESPKWQPAVQYNRLVKAYRIQPITFPKVTN
jgi:TonB family protein